MNAPTSTPQTSVLPLNLSVLHKIMPHAPGKFLGHLNQAMSHYQINNPNRVAGFLAQLAVESNELRHTHEMWTSRKDFHLPGVNRPKFTAGSAKEYFEHWYGNRKGLGNTTAEDGYTYRGRGAIQITGKANYSAIGNAIGKPLLTNPDLLESDPHVDMLASAYFFAKMKHLLHVADSVDPSKPESVAAVNLKMTHAVNGGTNGLSQRLHYYTKALQVLGAS